MMRFLAKLIGLILMIAGIIFFFKFIAIWNFFTLEHRPVGWSVPLIVAGVFVLIKLREYRILGWLLIAVGIVIPFTTGIPGTIFRSIIFFPFLLAFGTFTAGYQLLILSKGNTSKSVNFISRKILILLSVTLSIVILLLRILTLPHSLEYAITMGITPAFFSRFSFHIFRVVGQTEIPGYYWDNLVAVTIPAFSLVFILSFFEFKERQDKLPLLINIITIIVFMFMHEYVLLPDFFLNLKARATVVSMVKTDTLLANKTQIREAFTNSQVTDNKFYAIKLPSQYKHLSRGFKDRGEIEVITDREDKVKMIVFYTSTGKSRGQTDYTAFIYSSADNPRLYKELFGVGGCDYLIILDAKKLTNNWFWVDLYND